MKSITLELPDRLADLLAIEEMRARAIGVLTVHFEADLQAAEAEAAPAIVFSAGAPAPEAPEETAPGRGFDPEAVRRRMSALLGVTPPGPGR
jgi:hypothetical protein